MSAEVVFLLRLFGLTVIVLGIEFFLSRRALRRNQPSKIVRLSKYQNFKTALDKTYGGRHARHR